MSKSKSPYPYYENKDILPPSNEYWSQRRRVASLMRDLQERLQTTALPVTEVTALANQLEEQLASLSDEPQLLGRKAWVEAKNYGDNGVLHNEVTPIIGASNVVSPDLSIWFEGDRVLASLRFGWAYEGASNIAHGGWVAAVFDEFLGLAQIISGGTGMTAYLTTRYHKPTPLNQELRLEAKVLRADGRKITMLGEMWVGDIKTASCEGMFVSATRPKD